MPITDKHSSPFARLMEGISNILRTGTWEGDEPTTEQLLDAAEEETRHDAEVTAGGLDAALTEYHILQGRMTRARDEKTMWFERMSQVGEMLQGCSDEERPSRQKLLDDARTEYERAKRIVSALDAELQEVEPLAEETLSLLEQSGVEREGALSTVARMRIESASAETKQRLAMAKANTPKLQLLLDEARRRIDDKTAEAAAWEEIAPKTETDPTSTS